MNAWRHGIAVVLATSSMSLHAAEPTQEDFAYVYPVTAIEHAPFYRVEIPRFVYETVARPDLGDLRVFDRDGAIVPHLIRRQAQREETRNASLPLFPVYARTLADDLSLKIEKDANGTIVNVHSTGKAGGQPGELRDVAFYLLDASKVNAPMQGLQLEWSGAGFVGDLRVEASEDLVTWTQLTRTPVAKLLHAGHALNHGRIAFGPRKTRYLRLTWAQTAPAVSLRAASAETVTHPERERQWVSLAGAADPKTPGDYVFSLRGAMPVDRARVVLPQSNTVITATLHSRADHKASWGWRAGGVVSNAGADAALPDNELTLPPRPPMAHWLLRVEQKEAGLGRGEPALQLGWIADELVFVARGEPPYKLAFGNANADRVTHGLDQLLAHAGDARVVTAQLQPLATLRGDTALHASMYAVDWKRASLWSVLVLGVVMLGVMARRLLRELN